MRKLLLFGLLGAIFGFALALEHVFSKQEKPREVAANKAILSIGGGPPRAIPETPPPERRDDGESARDSSRVANALQKNGTSAAPRPPPRPFVAPAPTPTPPPAPAVKFHVVAKGETLSEIAHDELGSATKWKELARWNGLADASRLELGARLRLAPPDDGVKGERTDARASTTTPPPTNVGHGSAADAKRTHKVEKGETLSKIAARCLGDAARWREIQRLNRIGDPANVGEGALLELPER